MGRKKICIVVMIVIPIIAISMTAFASKKLVRYNEQGKVIIYSGEERPEEIEAGTPAVIAIPTNSKNKLKTDSEIKSQKEVFIKEVEQKAKTATTEDIAKYTETKNAIPDEIEEVSFNTILMKYYGKEKITGLYEIIDKEQNGVVTYGTEPTTLNNSQKELFKMALELIDGTKATSEEKEILRDSLKSIDISNMEDKEFVDKVNSL